MTDPSPWWDRDVYADRRPFLLARGRILSALRDWFRRARLPGGRDPGAAGLARQRGPSACLRDRADDARRRPRAAALPAHLAGIHLQEAAGRRRGAGVQPVACVPQPRARAAASSRIHHAGVVSDQRALRDADGGLRRDPGRGGQGGRRAATAMEGPQRRSLCRRRAAQRRRRIREVRRHRSAGDAGRRRRQPRPARRRRPQAAGVQVADDDTWSDMFSRVLVERIEPQLGHRPADRARPISAAGGGVGAARRRPARWRSASSSTPAASSSPTALPKSPTPPSSAAASRSAMAERQRRYGEHYPIDDDFLAALGAMPPASGIALGFDRLVMLADRRDRGSSRCCGRRWPATTANASH